jgi:hypothetical protein
MRQFVEAASRSDPGGNKAARDGWAQQQMIDAQSGIAAKSVPEILPERIDPLIRVECPERVGRPRRQLPRAPARYNRLAENALP